MKIALPFEHVEFSLPTKSEVAVAPKIILKVKGLI